MRKSFLSFAEIIVALAFLYAVFMASKRMMREFYYIVHKKEEAKVYF
jgi:hypothetical protein